MITLKYRPLWYTTMWFESFQCWILSVSIPGILVVLKILSYCQEHKGTIPWTIMGSSSCLSTNLLLINIQIYVRRKLFLLLQHTFSHNCMTVALYMVKNFTLVTKWLIGKSSITKLLLFKKTLFTVCIIHNLIL